MPRSGKLNTETILVIDDERVILDLTSIILRNKGYTVYTASSPIDGFALIERHRPALVLLDYMMPNMDGLTALKEIRQRFLDTYVIMFTGKGSEEIAVKLMKAGAYDYILKPFNNHDLADRIDNVLKIRRIELKNRDLLIEREKLLKEIEKWNQELENRVQEKSEALERAQAEIVQSEKLATIGYLSAGMAHEIRNPLNSISLFTQLIAGGLDDEERQEYTDKILKEVQRIDTILRNLLNASKRPKYKISDVQIDTVIDGATEAFRPRIENQGIRFERRFVKLPPAIKADRAEIEQIFTNLFLNAMDEMTAGGDLTVVLDHDDDYIIVRVTDTGKGIPRENLSNIFDPFFTTKSGGSGLGLSVVLRIVKTYKGKISVDSAPGKGTTFNVKLPLDRPEVQPEAARLASV